MNINLFYFNIIPDLGKVTTQVSSLRASKFIKCSAFSAYLLGKNHFSGPTCKNPVRSPKNDNIQLFM